MTEDNEPTIEVEDREPNHIELVVKEYKPSRSATCKMFDRCRHKKSPKWIAEFRQLHPECF